MSIVLCVVVVGSCIAVIARWAGKGMEPATPPKRQERAPAAAGRHAAVARVAEREPALVGGPPPLAPPTPVPAARVAVPSVEAEPAPALEPPRPARRPSPAEAARRQAAERGTPVGEVPWWRRARAAAGLTLISVTLGLLAAATIGLVLFGGYLALKSL